MPILWKDVRRGLDAKKFTLRSAATLLRKARPWEGYAEAARSLADAIRSVTATPRAKARRN
jgi:bifunctional non-homologous end joining protein LigD